MKISYFIGGNFMFRYNFKKNFIFLKDYIKKASNKAETYDKNLTNPFINQGFKLKENTYVWVEKP